MNFDRRIDPKKVFEFLSKNYDSWSQFMHEDKNRKLGENGDVKNVNPIYDYNLLELIEETANRHPNLFPEWELENKESGSGSSGNNSSLNNSGASGNIKKDTKNVGNDNPNSNANSSTKSNNTNSTNNPTPVNDNDNNKYKEKKKRDIKYPTKSFLQQNEMEYLRSKLSSMMSEKKGFNLYDTKDEEGLCTYEPEDEDEEEYDLSEVENDYGTEHHFELELKPECEVHGDQGCDCDYDEEFQGEEYDFTFEYNSEGKLVPTFDGSRNYNSSKIEEIKDKKKKKKKGKKKKLKPPKFSPEGGDNCLFCDYEAVFGKKPVNLIRFYNDKVYEEELKRFEIRKKLQNAKLKALKKQKDLRVLQKEQREKERERLNKEQEKQQEQSQDNHGP